MTVMGTDHVAITVADLDRSTVFYRDVLGARIVADHEINGEVAVRLLAIGNVAGINLHVVGHGHWLVAKCPTSGSLDLCFRWAHSSSDAIAHLAAHDAELIEGPVPRVSASGLAGQSVYLRDPYGNLLELLSTVAV